MRHNLGEIFGLPAGLRAGTMITTSHYVVIQVSSSRVRTRCPHCTTGTKRVHQRTTRLIKHGKLDDKIVVLELTVKRFRCPGCCRTFVEKLSDIDRKQSTAHFRHHVLQELSEHSLRTAARHTQTSPTSMSRALDSVSYEINWDAQGETFSLGLDEHSYRHRWMVMTVTNLTKKSLVTILPDDSKKEVKNFLAQIPIEAQRRLKEICIDMRSSFRYAIEEALPGMKIVVDPFHVVKLAGTTMEDVRRVVISATGKQLRVKRLLRTPVEQLTPEDQQKLAALWAACEKFPSLRLAWTTKEKIREMYRVPDRQKAEHQFRLLLAYLSDTESRYLKQLRGTLVRWQDYILNHFDQGTSNGFTEGVHTKIKMVKRMSYGFPTVDHYIKKMLLAFLPLEQLKTSR